MNPEFARIKAMTDAELRLARSQAESKLAPLISESNRRAKLVNARKKLKRAEVATK